MVGAEVQRSSSQASGLTASLSSSRPKPAKQEVKDRDGRDQVVDLMFDRKRVPLEALVRRSSPIAVAVKEEEEPAEPQVTCCCCCPCARGPRPTMHTFPLSPLLLAPTTPCVASSLPFGLAIPCSCLRFVGFGSGLSAKEE